jgi:hypothetical protein
MEAMSLAMTRRTRDLICIQDFAVLSVLGASPK